MRTIYTFLFLLLSVLLARAQDPVVSPVSETRNTSLASGYNAIVFSVNKVYPNPVRDKVTLEIQAGQPGDVQLSLINILGSVVKQWEPVYLNGGDQKIQLNLSSFQPGIYFLRLTKSNQVITQMLKKT